MSANKTKSVRTETASGPPKILLFDIENFANISYTWAFREQDVIEIIEPRMICSIAWQWYPSRECHVLALCDMPGYNPRKRNNKALLKSFKKVLEKADIAIGHNIDGFDDRRVNTEMLKNKITPHPTRRTIDTLQVLRRRFDFNSNRLNDVCKELGIGQKVKHPGFQMWKDCEAGIPKAWKKMKEYNKADVSRLLRPLYERIRPWMTNHPNMNAPDGNVGCPVCRSKFIRRNGWNLNKWGRTMRWRCEEPRCGKSFTGAFVKKQWRMG